MSINFGTDGWRAIIGEEFTFPNVRACTQGLADYLKKSEGEKCNIVVGYDTRFASEEFAKAVTEVLVANGIQVYLSNSVVPTPVISYFVRLKGANGAVIITASHNPKLWNGFKYKSGDGGSASDDVTNAISENSKLYEASSDIPFLGLDHASKKGLLESVSMEDPYLAHISTLLDINNVRNSDLKVIVDPMHGAGAGYLGNLLSGGSISLTEMRGERNPFFPDMKNPEPLSHNLKSLSELVKSSTADVGIAFDGDADRVGVVDENGEFVTTLQFFALLCLYLLEVRDKRGPIIKSLTSSSMLFRLGEIYDVPVYEAPVGFKHICPLMMDKNAIIGGEESGGYGFGGHIPERDGILSAAFFLDMMCKTGKSVSELVGYLYEKVGPHHYKRLDIEFPKNRRKDIEKCVSDVSYKSLAGMKITNLDFSQGLRFTFEKNQWLMIRFSGTEPLLRIYAEAESAEKVDQLLSDARAIVGI